MRWWCLSAMRGRARNAMSLCTSIYRLSRGKRLYWAQGSTRRPVPSSSHRSRILPFFSGPKDEEETKEFFEEEDGSQGPTEPCVQAGVSPRGRSLLAIWPSLKFFSCDRSPFGHRAVCRHRRRGCCRCCHSCRRCRRACATGAHRI